MALDPGARSASKDQEALPCGAAGSWVECPLPRAYRFEHRAGLPRLRPDFRRCLVLYVFVMHAVLGLIHVQIHTWFPLTVV